MTPGECLPEKSSDRGPALPLFQLTGGTSEFRGQFIRRLMAALPDRSLACRCLERADVCSRISLLSLIRRYDLVVADADLEVPLETVKISCGMAGQGEEFCWSGGDDLLFQQFVDKLIQKLDSLVRRIPVWGCVLIGGKSSRMGCPKHLLRNASGTTWLEHAVDVLSPLLDGIAISGDGLFPRGLQSFIRLPDVPGVSGPLTGILAAGRWLPMVSWLVVACDMPHITEEAAKWLLAGRRAGCWGVVPRLAEKRHYEPLFSWYDFRAAEIFEEHALNNNLRIGAVARHPKIDNPFIPERLRFAWQNVNTPEQLQTLSW